MSFCFPRVMPTPAAFFESVSDTVCLHGTLAVLTAPCPPGLIITLETTRDFCGWIVDTIRLSDFEIL